MGFRGPKVVEKGMFTSPALGADSPYELIIDKSMPNGLAVRCVESKETYGTEILATPTLAEVNQQHNAFVREVCAWLVANSPAAERQAAAVSEIRRLTALDYTSDDLTADVEWIRQTEISHRLRILAAHLDDGRRMGLLRIAAAVAASSGLGETDAQFIERLGTGLGFDEDTVMQVVITAMNSGQAAA